MPIFLLALLCSLPSNKTTFSATEAEVIFNELATCLDGDHQNFWNPPLPAKAILFDPQTGRAACNSNPGQGVFEKQGAVWIGQMPQGPNINGPVLSWVGQTWALIRWPLSPDPLARKREMVSRLWFPRAEALGLPLSIQENAHLNSLDGRLWMRLEWRALKTALQAEDLAMRGAVADALTFRRHRRNMSDTAPFQEQTSELVEGLAAYTGLMLSGEPDPQAWLLDQLDNMESAANYARDFPKWSGPAYGLLLDRMRPGWRKNLNANQDLGAMLEVGMTLIIPKAWYDAATLRAKSYRIDQIRQEEIERAEYQKQWKRSRLQLFVEEGHLDLPLSQLPLQETYASALNLGQDIYYLQTFEHKDEWGTLVTNAGAVLRISGSKLSLTLPTSISKNKLQGDGWAIELQPDWETAPGSRDGDLILVKK